MQTLKRQRGREYLMNVKIRVNIIDWNQSKIKLTKKGKWESEKDRSSNRRRIKKLELNANENHV